jgi:hypothetical protein
VVLKLGQICLVLGLEVKWNLPRPIDDLETHCACLARLLPPDAVSGKWRRGDCKRRLTEFLMEDIPVPKENSFWT